jgi:hypothetical protein
MKPKIIIAQVEASGTAGVAATNPVAPPGFVFQMSEANELFVPSKASRFANCIPETSKVSWLYWMAVVFPFPSPNWTANSNVGGFLGFPEVKGRAVKVPRAVRPVTMVPLAVPPFKFTEGAVLYDIVLGGPSVPGVVLGGWRC